jgi:peptide/nickel transport system substrate-binding protein
MRKLPCIVTGSLFCWFTAMSFAGENMSNKPLRYWFWYLPTTLDTAKADRAGVMAIAKNIYAPLISTYLDGTPQGLIAEKWAVDNSGKTWRFKIRKNLVFDDGTPITPEIVLQNFRRILWLTRNDGLLFNSLLPEVAKWTNYASPLKSVYADGDEIVFKFSKRPLNLFEEISMPIYGIASPKCFDENGNWKDLFCSISSGQYKVKELAQDKVVLQSRHVYSEVENAPEIVEVRARADKNTAEEILAGHGDLTVMASLDITDELQEKVHRSEIHLAAEPAARMHFMELNAKRPAFADKNLRQSIRNTFLSLLHEKDVFAGANELDPSFIPKGGVGHVKFDIHKAERINKRHESEAVILLSPPPPSTKSRGQKIQQALEDTILKTLSLHSIKAQIVKCDGGELIERRRRNDFDLLFRSSGVSIDDPYAALRMMFMSDIGACIPDPSRTVPGLIIKAEASDNPSLRKKLAEKINRTIYEEASVITYAHSSIIYVGTNKVDFSRINLFSDPIEFRAINWRP